MWYWTRLLRDTWTARRSYQSILMEINHENSLEWLMLRLKCQYFGHLMWRADSLEKANFLGKIEGGRRRGTTEDEIVEWHHWLNGHKCEQAPGDGEWQGSLACCSAWGSKESDMTEWLNRNNSVMIAHILSIKVILSTVKFVSFTSQTSPMAELQRICLQCRRHSSHGFNPWVGKIPWRRKWQFSQVTNVKKNEML